MNHRFLTLRNKSDALVKVYQMRQLFDQLWPNILGNQPDKTELLQAIQINLDQLTIIARDKVQEECDKLSGPDDPGECVFLAFREAAAMLPKAGYIKTARQPGNAPVLIAADWPRRRVIEVLSQYPPQLSGERATADGFGLVIIDAQGPLFIETRKDE